MDKDRFLSQLQFITEIDQLKLVLRQTLLMDQSRQENSAEHSWHLAIMAIVLEEYVPVPVDLRKVITMVLVHDLVEIDAGDVFCFDAQGNVGKADREQQAADRIFGLLPPEQSQDFRQIWDEFEAQDSWEAKFAAALDRIQPFLHNLQTSGGTWRKYGIQKLQVLQRMAPVQQGMPDLWPWVEEAIAQGVANGLLKE